MGMYLEEPDINDQSGRIYCNTTALPERNRKLRERKLRLEHKITSQKTYIKSIISKVEDLNSNYSDYLNGKSVVFDIDTYFEAIVEAARGCFFYRCINKSEYNRLLTCDRITTVNVRLNSFKSVEKTELDKIIKREGLYNKSKKVKK